MRKLIPLLFALLIVATVPAPSYAQQATLPAPLARASEDNRQVVSYYATSDAGGRWEAIVAVRDNAFNEIRRESYSGPDATHPSATAAAFNTAVINVRATETGTDVRKVRFRITGFLKDQSYDPFTTSTLVP